MLETHIIRTAMNHKDPQLGVFLIEGKACFLTLELPWRDNEQRVSCIPEGTYLCVRVYNRLIGTKGFRVKETFEVLKVPGRSGILFHTGNQTKDTQGCILIGQTLVAPDWLGGSRLAFDAFLHAFLDVSSFKLTVQRAFTIT